MLKGSSPHCCKVFMSCIKGTSSVKIALSTTMSHLGAFRRLGAYLPDKAARHNAQCLQWDTSRDHHSAHLLDQCLHQGALC